MNDCGKKPNFLMGLVVVVFLFVCSLYTKCFTYVAKKLADYQGLKPGDNYLKILPDEFEKRDKDHSDMGNIIENNKFLKLIYDRKKQLTNSIKNYGAVGLIKHAKPPKVQGITPLLITEDDGVENGTLINIFKNPPRETNNMIEMMGSLDGKSIEAAIDALLKKVNPDLIASQKSEEKEEFKPVEAPLPISKGPESPKTLKVKKKKVSPLKKNKPVKKSKHKFKNKKITSKRTK